MNDNKKRIVYIVIIFILVIILGVLIYLVFSSKKGNISNSSNSINKTDNNSVTNTDTKYTLVKYSADKNIGILNDSNYVIKQDNNTYKIIDFTNDSTIYNIESNDDLDFYIGIDNNLYAYGLNYIYKVVDDKLVKIYNVEDPESNSISFGISVLNNKLIGFYDGSKFYNLDGNEASIIPVDNRVEKDIEMPIYDNQYYAYSNSYCNKNLFSNSCKKVGLYDYINNKVIIDSNIYSDIEFAPNKNLIVKKDNKYGIVDINNDIKVPFEYDYITFNTTFSYSYYLVIKDNKLYVMDYDFNLSKESTDVENVSDIYSLSSTIIDDDIYIGISNNNSGEEVSYIRSIPLSSTNLKSELIELDTFKQKYYFSSVSKSKDINETRKALDERNIYFSLLYDYADVTDTYYDENKNMLYSTSEYGNILFNTFLNLDTFNNTYYDLKTGNKLDYGTTVDFSNIKLILNKDNINLMLDNNVLYKGNIISSFNDISTAYKGNSNNLFVSSDYIAWIDNKNLYIIK